MTSADILNFAEEVHALSVEKGWYADSPCVEDIFVMVHCELSEAVEEYRNGHGLTEIYYGKDGKPEGIPIELADAVIRVLDAAVEYGGYKALIQMLITRDYPSFGAFIDALHEDVVSMKCNTYIFQTAGITNDSFSVFISRVKTWFDRNGMDLWRVCRMKHEYNKTRPYRHGGKRM